MNLLRRDEGAIYIANDGTTSCEEEPKMAGLALHNGVEQRLVTSAPSHRPVFTLVHSRVTVLCNAMSGAVTAKSFAIVASLG